MTGVRASTRRLRILVYANVERDEAGGAQAVVRSLCDHLRARGHRVSIGWSSASGGGKCDADEWAEQFPARIGKRRWLHLPTAVRLLARLLRERPDVVNIHFASPSARYFYLLAPLLGYRTVLTCHGSDVLRPLPQDAPQLAAIITGADAVTAVSHDIAAKIDTELGPQRVREVTVIANGVDASFWHPAPPDASEKRPAAGRIVAIGRLEQVKGFDLLIEALARLRVAGTAVRLSLVGDGSQRAALEQQAQRAGVDDEVEFVGRLSREAVRARLHAADLFVLPSRSEGTPLALLEAMATGMACVAADVGGVARTAAGTAELVPAEDPDALAAAVEKLLNDSAARGALGRRARERALDFSIEHSHDTYAAVMLGVA